METKLFRFTHEHAADFTSSEKEAIREAGRILKSGGLVAFPTETVYGLGGDALNPSSSKKIYAAKGRPSDNPLIVHIAEKEDLKNVAEDIPEEAWILAEHFLPGPLTMILKKKAHIPSETTGGLSTVAVRMPSSEIAREMIREGGGYIAAPSANRSGRPSPTLAKYVMEDLAGNVELVLDGGSSVIGLESTIIDLTVSPPAILRPGAITEKMLSDVLGKVRADHGNLPEESKEAPKAPGMKYRHYAPQGDLTVVRGKQENVVSYVNEAAAETDMITAVISSNETAGLYKTDIIKTVGAREDEDAIGRNLFRVLRELDDEGAQLIFAESFEGAGVGTAVMNRLLKAAGHKEITV